MFRFTPNPNNRFHRMFIMVMIQAFVVLAFNDVTKPYTFSSGTVISSSNVNSTLDTLTTRINDKADTTDHKFVRFTDLTGGDSTLKRIQVDTIRSNPDVDSIKGNPFIDTVTTRYVVADSVIGPVRGTVLGNVTGDASGTAATVTGAAQAAITSVGTLTGLTMGGNITTSTNDIITDSIYARTVKLNNGALNTGTGDVTTDSVYARTLINTGNAGVGMANPAAYANRTTLGISGSSGGVLDLCSASVRKASFYNIGSDVSIGTVTAGSLNILANNQARLTILSSGFVGIDTIGPIEKFHVNRGNLKADTIKGAITTGNLAVNTGTGDITTDSVYARTVVAPGRITALAGILAGEANTIDSIRIVDGGAVDTMKIYGAGQTTPYRILR